MQTISWQDFEMVELRVGTLVRVEPFPEARRPAYKVWADFGPELGVRKSSAQIILRWHIQEGNIVFPKSTNPQHLRDNFDIFDFELTDGEMDRIRALDRGVRYFNMSLAEQEATLGGFRPAD